MDISYEEQNVGYVVADLNRMKQGNAAPSAAPSAAPWKR